MSIIDRPTGAQLDTEKSKRLDSATALKLALVVGAAVRLIDLGYQSYSMDELWELAIVYLPAGEIIAVGDGFPPLFHIIFHGLVVAGLGDMSGRFLSAALGIATIWVAGRLGRKISPAVGAGSALAVAVAPLLVLLSKEGRAYGIFILFATLLLLATWEVIDSHSTGSWIFFGVVASLGMYTHYMFALALVSAELILLWHLRQGLSVKRWIVTNVAMALALVPLVLIAVADFELDASNNYSPTVDIAALGYAGLSLFTGFTLGPSARALHTLGTSDAIRGAAPWIVLIGLPAVYLAYHGWKGMTADWRLRLSVPLLVPMALLTLFSAVVGVAFRVRYVAWLVVPLAIWLAIGYTRSTSILRHISVGTLVVVAFISLGTRVTVSDYAVEDARQAAAYVTEYPEMPVVAMAWYMARPIEYYIDPAIATNLPEDEGSGRFGYHALLENRIVPLPEPIPGDTTFSAQLEVLDATVPVGEEYLFVYSRPFHGDPEGAFLESRRTRDELSVVVEYAGIAIFRGRRGG